MQKEEEEEVVVCSVTAAGYSQSNVCCNKFNFSLTLKRP